MTETKIAMTIEEAAAYTGIGRNTMRNLVEWGKLPVLKVGRKVLIKSDILESFMELNEGKNLRDKSEVKAVTRKRQFKRRLPRKPPSGIYQTEAMIYLHANRL